MFKTYTINEFVTDIYNNYNVVIEFDSEIEKTHLITSLISEYLSEKELKKSDINEFEDFVNDFFSERLIPKNLDLPFNENYYCAAYGLSEFDKSLGYFLDSIDEKDQKLHDFEYKEEFFVENFINKMYEHHYNTIIIIFKDGLTAVLKNEDKERTFH